jgi:hypothetical protein
MNLFIINRLKIQNLFDEKTKSTFRTYLDLLILNKELILYISPSTFYKNEFHERKLYKQIKAYIDLISFQNEHAQDFNHTGHFI